MEKKTMNGNQLNIAEKARELVELAENNRKEEFKLSEYGAYIKKCMEDREKRLKLKNTEWLKLEEKAIATGKPISKAQKGSYDLRWNRNFPPLKQNITRTQIDRTVRNAEFYEKFAFSNVGELDNRLAVRFHSQEPQIYVFDPPKKLREGVVTRLNSLYSDRIIKNHDKPSRDEATEELFFERTKYGEFKPYSMGNSKILDNVICINFSSATYCPSKSCKDCKLGNKCYAFKYERAYKTTLIRNECNQWYWKYSTAEEIFGDFLAIRGELTEKYGYVKKVRLSVEGDFTTPEVVDKVKTVALLLDYFDMSIYTYTHRQGEDMKRKMKDLPKNLTINGSVKGMGLSNEFLAVPESELPSGAKFMCPCAEDEDKRCGVHCNLCYSTKGITIYEKLRD